MSNSPYFSFDRLQHRLFEGIVQLVHPRGVNRFLPVVLTAEESSASFFETVLTGEIERLVLHFDQCGVGRVGVLDDLGSAGIRRKGQRLFDGLSQLGLEFSISFLPVRFSR